MRFLDSLPLPFPIDRAAMHADKGLRGMLEKSAHNAAAREPIVISLPVIIKSSEKDGKRLIECEASVEQIDSEGDLIEQKALLDAGPEFVKTGHFDIDHLSEIGTRYGIPNPESYIVGRPTEVVDLGDKRTGVRGEISRSASNTFDPVANRYDSFWNSLQSKPAVMWRASIYGFPTDDGWIDCRTDSCPSKAQRFHIKALSWRSLAFTRNPINDNIKGHVKVFTAKAYALELLKYSNGYYDGTDVPVAYDAVPQPAYPCPSPISFDEAIGQYYKHMRIDCPHTDGVRSAVAFARHFSVCCGMSKDSAEVWGRAVMHFLLSNSV